MTQDLRQMYRRIVSDHFPEEITITFGNQKLVYKKRTWKIRQDSGEIVEQGLRYGENPDQQAALYELVGGNLILGDCQYIDPGKGLVSSITEEDLLQSGKHPGKINLTDVDNGLNVLKFLMEKPTALILKHNNPCGAASGGSLAEAFLRAYRADRVAAFGGCVVLNRPIDKETAEAISAHYLEVVAAPEFEDGTLEILKKRKDLRLIRISRIDRLADYCKYRYIDFKSLIDGGLIVQQSQINRIMTPDDFIPATAEHNGRVYKIKRKPTEREARDLLFGWFVEQGVTSNSVLYVKDECTVAIGTGEQDRVGVAEIAVFKAYQKYADALCYDRHKMSYKELELAVRKGEKSEELLKEIDDETREARGGLNGAVMVSDGFFPFRDGVDVGIREGITAVIQPGGSVRDWEVIEACNEANVAMVFTGQRAFKH
ncbi:IMP cyclohydrolase [Thermodesulforhabdus norvegica]|uniref:Phosphoribosylaminoimidazolecarboxamide formyltransferase / IMP cyclohydrolase n=1 Tax=Thermodesulforhabdus norvegica TaxID=39841 RepID=A0A1I4SBH1_9BACT|nr:IMP cyclohydrolase [Thermodesulforhabdus norvegica]SFM61681.1 phosphoribosylaminoimidazolecarboxamide formyltransferase / IMP cyclohydrolase [Thermodesulforhabdus norvegica]